MASDGKPYVYLGQPSYGRLTAGAARAFWRSTRLPDDHVFYQHNCSSLLAGNFNGLWTAALNVKHCGGRVDYFAMQHADVEPEDWWLDMLIDELERHDLDILGVVVPIKDTKGLTSIALADPEGDTWSPKCRLTMTEAYRLPETFTSEDVGHPLLLNTGLWVCRFGEWAKKVRFTINDRIVFDRSLDRYIAQVEPEDWYFSRLCHELGLRIGATRKIKLVHRGEMAFTNTHPWGDAFDRAYIPASVLPEQERFQLPFITGWLTTEEGEALAELARGRRVLEIGSYCGCSTVCMARTAEHVTACDYFDGRGTPLPQNTFDEFRRNIEQYGVAHKVATHHPDEPFPESAYDLVFIDGAHDCESVRADIKKVLPALKPGGLFAFHDYRNGNDPGVERAVDEFLAEGGELLSVHGSLAVVKPPVATTLEV